MYYSFVVDANIIFNAIINKEGKTWELLIWNYFNLSSVLFLIKEINRQHNVFNKKWVVLREDYTRELITNIKIYDKKFISDVMFEVYTKVKLVDGKDTPYVALAYKLWIPLWTNDKKLKEQVKFIEIVNTTDVLNVIRK